MSDSRKRFTRRERCSAASALWAEFFFATPAEVRKVLAEKVGNLLEFADEPEATQYLQSKGYWPESMTIRAADD